MYGQLINDARQETIVSFSDLMFSALTAEQKLVLAKADEAIKDMTAGRKKAYCVGYMLGFLASELGVKEIVFDRSGYRYHGLVQALADGARAGGLIF